MKSYGVLRFVATPELKETTKQVKYSVFTLAYNEQRKSSVNQGEWIDVPHFFEFEVWDKGAEAVCKMFEKGDPIFVEDASPRQHTWEDKESGQKRSKIVFRLNSFKPLYRAPKKETEPETKA